MNTKTNKPHDWLTTGQVAVELGVQPITVGRWIDAGKLPGIRFGRDRRVRRDVLDAFLKVENARFDAWIAAMSGSG